MSTQWNSSFLALLCLSFIFLLYFFSTNEPGSILNNPMLQIFKTIFISIILEAMPFILIGVFISALLQVFVSEQTIKRMIPKNPVLGIITASVIGIIFPICECGMVPAIRKLIKKGMPLYAAVTFILVGPILNPIVFWSTWTAFRNRPEITYSRMGLAFLVALVVGLIVYRFVKANQLRDGEEIKQSIVNKNKEKFKHSEHHHDHSAHLHNHTGHSSKRPSKIIEVMGHATSEFFEMGKYLVFGAMLVGLLQTVVAQSTLFSLGQGQVSSNLLMMGLGFILSLCSTSDAFVAQSFTSTFSKSSLVVFMVFGPMINLKGILMMLAVFKPRFVVLLSSLVFFFVLVGALLLEWFIL
ncbi:permease [Bacillus sp. FJAT-29790]|nr:permease [Bacillus sp. FJAT-29790]